MSQIRRHVCLAALAFVVSADAQEPAQTGSVAIHGAVIEAATHVPIVGAQVVLRYATSQIALQTVNADINGAFHFSVSEAGEYAIEASTGGYLPVVARMPIDEAALANSSATAARTITLALSQSITIAGRVRDGSTREGLPGITVTALRLTYLQGKRLFNPDRIGFTDDQGDFRLEELTPGEYFIEIKKFPPGPIIAGRQADYTAESRRSDRYPQTIWPGDGFDSDARPLAATTSGEINVGNLDLEKVEPGRIRGAVAASGCVGTYNLDIEQRFGSRIVESRAATLPCGSAFTIPNLSPGDYRIRAQTNVVTHDTLTGIRMEPGGDRDVSLKLQRPGAVDGSIVLECKNDCRGATAIRDVLLEPVVDPSVPGAASQVENNNVFRLVMPGADRVRIVARPMPNGMFIKRVLYNGAEVGTTFTKNPPAESETLQIVLSDQTSALTGIVTKDGKPVADAHVAIARWPLVLQDGWPDCTWVAVQEDGGFAFTGLPPGRYLVVSLSPLEWARWNVPSVAANALSTGLEVTLDEADAKSIILKQP